MPDVFKALATIMAWVLWISALVMGFGTLIVGILAEDLFNPDVTVPMSYPASFAVAGAYGLLALLAMKIRKGME